MIKAKYLLFLFFTLLSMDSFSQELFKKELKWEFSDSTEKQVFHDRENIKNWSEDQHSFSTSYSIDMIIKKRNIHFMIVTWGSGLPHVNIYIFKEENEFWKLVASTHTLLKEKIIEIQETNDKIVFNTKSGSIGELSISALDLYIDK